LIIGDKFHKENESKIGGFKFPPIGGRMESMIVNTLLTITDT